MISRYVTIVITVFIIVSAQVVSAQIPTNDRLLDSPESLIVTNVYFENPDNQEILVVISFDNAFYYRDTDGDGVADQEGIGIIHPDTEKLQAMSARLLDAESPYNEKMDELFRSFKCMMKN
ncbi:MAG: hypothetical protein WD335_03135 [Candidatus Paceibacterota bacterium]